MPPVTEISYSSLEQHRRCGYRFYLERVLGVRPVERAGAGGSAAGAPGAGEALGGTARGVIVHALLESLDFRRPVVPDTEAVGRAAGFALGPEDAAGVLALVEGFAGSETCARLGRATSVRSEQGFSFLLASGSVEPSQPAGNPVLFRGVFDVIAQERSGATLVVDYKTDQLAGAEPEAVVAGAYATQRLIYGLATLRSGARRVEVVHAFLERPEAPAVARFEREDMPRLEEELGRLTADMVSGQFPVSPLPHRSLCHGCPAEGGLCSWPVSATRRESPDQLF